MNLMAAAPPSAPHPRSRASVTAAARRWLGLGLDLVYPPHCAFCHEAIANSLEGLLCPACRAAFVDHRPACSRCGALGDRASGSRCTVCSNTRFHFGAVARLGAYEGPLRQAVLRLKHASQRGLAIAMGDWLAVSCSTQWPKFNVDAVVPVPMHWSRKMWRGANSPETIAERVANRLRLPTAGHLLVRNRRTAP
jgi:predicted amidophosphoribosyltransferase